MVKITFVGDILCEEQQLKANKVGDTYNFTDVFSNTSRFFNSSDFIVGNLETPIAGENFKYTNHKWSFNSPLAFAIALKKAGFNLVTTANNHCLDRGFEGLYSTLKNLNKIDLDYTGTFLSREESRKTYIKNVEGTKIAFISYTYGTNASFNKMYLKKDNEFAVNLFRQQERKHNKKAIITRVVNRLKYSFINNYTINRRLLHLKRRIKIAKKDADIVCVLMHSGGQYNTTPDKWTVSLMDFLFKTEVEFIIGCHPHVVQKVIVSGNQQIGAFSLGNFCSYPGSESCKMNYSEYSIVLHTYLDKNSKKLEKTTFQIAKSVIDSDGKAKIHLLFDLINQEHDNQKKERLIKDNLLIVNRFLDTKLKRIKLEKEYLLTTIMKAN